MSVAAGAATAQLKNETHVLVASGGWGAVRSRIMAELVYEMVWDCRYCGARKLLGLTHRHCPNCGAPQDPNARYFPADNEKVAVQNHEYVGADTQCRYCGGASSKRAHNCGQCGAPLAEGGPVQPLAAPLLQPLAAPGLVGASPRISPWKVVLPVLALLVVAVLVLLVVWKKEAHFVVASHAWRRTINVERLGPSRESAWCSELPAAASDVSRHRERHGSTKVPDGEDCHAQRHDRGDGTFKEEQVCKPKFKDEPVFDEKCDYVLVKWSQLRQEAAEGQSVSDAPRWPSVTLARAGCAVAGCEREGSRSESYTVVFQDAKGESYRCDLTQSAWTSFAPGKRYAGKVRGLVGSLDCGSLSPAR